MSKRRSRPVCLKELNTSSSSDESDVEIIINDGKLKKMKVHKNMKKKISSRHPGLDKKNNTLFIKSRTHYINLIKFIHSKGLYSFTNNQIMALTSKNIEEAMTFNCCFPYQRIKDSFSSDILIFLEKYKKEILFDLKNWHENLEIPEIDPQRKRLKTYINDVVDILLKRPELNNTVIDVLAIKNINDKDMNIILNDLHKNDDDNYYRNYLKHILKVHYRYLFEILSKKLIFNFHENTTSQPNKQDGFTQLLNQSTASNDNDNIQSINANNISKNEGESQLNQQQSIKTSLNGGINMMKVCENITKKKVSAKHPALTKKYFELFIQSGTHYDDLIKFIHSKGLYSLTNNQITLSTKQDIKEAMKFIFKYFDQQINFTFSNYILIFLKKYNKEILDDLKNWDEHEKLPESDPQRKFLRIYINDIVDVLLRGKEFSNTIINILRNRKIDDIDTEIILNDLHKNDDDNYYRDYLKHILRVHYRYLIEILSKKLLLKFRGNVTSHQNEQDGFKDFTQRLDQSAALNKNNNILSINQNDVSKNQIEPQLIQQKSVADTTDPKLQEKIINNNNQKPTVNELSSQIPENIISSSSLIGSRESLEITSSQIIDCITKNLEDPDIITIDDSDDELLTNVKVEENNKDDDISSEIFATLMNNEIFLRWDEIKDKYLIKFILNNPNDLQKDCTYKKLLILEPQIFKGFTPENLRKRKDHLANSYEYLLKLCGSEKINTKEDKVVFEARIESLISIMNFSFKSEG